MERTLRHVLSQAGRAILNADLSGAAIEIPKDEALGDLSSPIAMVLAKTLKKPPAKIAADIIKAVKEIMPIVVPTLFPSLNKDGEGRNGVFEKIGIAGPGFLNFTFSKPFLCLRLKDLIDQNETFLTESVGKGKRIQIEFVSANPTGPLHLGHGRGAAVGAALANLLRETGYDVQREYYINDAGRQVRLLGLSVFARYKQLLDIRYDFPDDGYRGDYVEDIARELLHHNGDRFAASEFEEVADIFIDFSYQQMLDAIRCDLDDFGVFFDTWQSERALFGKGEVTQSIADLKKRGYIYEKDGAVWFQSTAFGDDKDRVIIKKDGEFTYFASDIAYHRMKVEKDFDEIIDIWGADHHGYIQRVQAVTQALGYPKESLRVLLVQMVSLLKAGQPVQMSKRAGEFITLREVFEEIGADTTKFLFLTRRSDSHLEIDIDVAKAQSQENPVFYVQYAYARINSVFQKSYEESGTGIQSSAPINDLHDFDGGLFNEEEMRIVRKLLLYPMIFKNAVFAREPHRITFYLQELAGLFHPYYHRHRIISDDKLLTKARLLLCKAIQIVLKHGLGILNVKAPERM